MKDARLDMIVKFAVVFGIFCWTSIAYINCYNSSDTLAIKPEFLNRLNLMKDQIMEKKIVDINKADICELRTLPGIGEAIAINILNYRRENGLFLSTEQIIKVDGVGVGKYNKIKKFIKIN